MMDTITLLGFGFAAGYAVGFMTFRKRPVYKITADLKIDQSAIENIEQSRVFAWLDQRGLTWMAKGAVFDSNRDVKR